MQNRWDLITSKLPTDGWEDGKKVSMSASEQFQVNTYSRLLKLLLWNVYESFLS